MKTKIYEWDGTQPPGLVPLIGRKVYGAWLFPSGKVLLLRLEGKKTLLIEGLPFVGDSAVVVLSFETGDEKAGANFNDFEKDVGPQPPHVKALRGMVFTGIDGSVVMFGDHGARFTPNGIRWVRAALPETASESGKG
jgi:hypothetical protein